MAGVHDHLQVFLALLQDLEARLDAGQGPRLVEAWPRPGTHVFF